MASIFRASATVQTASDAPESYGSGPNSSRAAAVAELNSVLATVIGLSILSYRISEQTDPATEGAALKGSAAQFEDAVLILQKSVNSKMVEKTLTIENMDLGYKVAVAGSNLIDVTDADLLAIATNYHDGTGTGGYDFKPGASYFKN